MTIPIAEITSAISGQRRRIAMGAQIDDRGHDEEGGGLPEPLVVADVLAERGGDADEGEDHGEDAVDGERVERPQPLRVGARASSPLERTESQAVGESVRRTTRASV